MFRNAVGIMYLILLVTGTLLSLVGFDAAWAGYNDAVAHSGARWFDDFGWRVVPRWVVATGWLLLTVAYAVAFFRKGLNLAMPFLYVLSGFLIGVVFMALTSLLKEQSAIAYAGVVVTGAVAALAAIGGFVFNMHYYQPTIFNTMWRRREAVS